MSYGLIYTIPFTSLHKEACLVEIEKENYTGASTELIASESPFEVEIEDDDFLYIPTRFSTARIRVVGSDYLQELYSTAYQQYRVTFKRGGTVAWRGFVKPEVYTQDYSSEKFELEIECISAMSSLEYINYKQVGTAGKIFVSIWDLLKKCVELSRGPYAEVYIPHVYAKDSANYTAGANVLEEMTVSEQDFFDEDNKPMKMKEVLEEVCKFLNWTCADYLGVLYFVDVDHTGDYYVYTGGMSQHLASVIPAVRNVQSIGFSGSNHTLDFIHGYNKVKVKTSNYPVGNLLPDEDFKKLTVAESPSDVTEEKKVSHKKVLLPAMWDMKQYIGNSDETQIVEVSKDWVIANKDKANMLMGAMPIRFCEYNLKEDLTPDISSYNYEDAIQVRVTTKAPPEYYSTSMDRTTILVIRGESAIYSEGALSISGSIRKCTNAGMGVVGGYGGYGGNKIRCALRIGKYWFNGKSWSDHPVIGEYSFYVQFEDCKEGVAWNNVKNTKTIDMPYNGLTGFIIPIDKSISGDLELTIQASNFCIGGPKPGVNDYGYFLKDFKFSYQKKDGSAKEDSNSDRYYENIVNDEYINELDEIEFKISSYNNDGACYSKVMLDSNYLTDNLYSSIVGKAVRPEEHLIQRIINRYSATHIKLTQVIKETQKLTPITKLSDNCRVSSIFINAGGSIDYKNGQFKCVMIEL